MRNLKRALSLALATVMTLGLMVVGTGAVGYEDVTSEDNVEAIEVLQAVGIMTGDENGNFNPDNLVTRNEMAVVMSQLLNLNYNYYRGTNPFTDVPSWAAPYVAACAAEGVTSGIGDGLYGGDQNVTAAQAALMILKALGYFQYQADFEGDWQVTTIRQASYINLFDGIDASAEEALTRNQIAQLVLNGLKSNMVEFTGNVGATVGDVVIGHNTQYTARTNAAQKYNKIDVGTTNIAQNDQYYIQLGEELYDGDLELRNNSEDDFGRPSRTWVYDGEDIGTYAKTELIRVTYTEKVEGGDIYNDIGSTACDYDLTYFVNGVEKSTSDTKDVADILARRNETPVGTTGNGVLTEVYVDTNAEETTIVEIHTYLAQATSDYNDRTEKLSLRVYLDVDKSGTTPDEDIINRSVDLDDFANIEDYEKDDFVLVTFAGEDREIKSIDDPEILSAVEISSYSVNGKDDQENRYMMKSITVDGTKYNASADAAYDAECLWNYAMSELKETTYNVILDQNGYVVGLEKEDGSSNYAFVVGYEVTSSWLASAVDKALVITVDDNGDAVMETVKIRDDKMPEDDMKQLFGQEKAKSHSGINKWITYEMDGDVMVMKSCVDEQFRDESVSTIDREYATLEGKEIAAAGDSFNGDNVVVYGNSKSVYVAVEGDDDVDETNGSIVDINGVTVGIKNTSIEVEKTYNYAKGAYVLYDGGYVKYAVVVGEDGSISDRLVYLTDGIGEKYYDKTLDKDLYVYEGIIGGEYNDRIISEVANDNTSSKADLEEGQLYTAKFDADGIITEMEPMDQNWYDAKTTSNKSDKYVLAISDTTVTDNGTHTLPADVELSLKGATLYINSEESNNHYVILDDDCQFFIRGTKEIRKQYSDYELYTDADSAIDALGNNSKFTGTFVAICDSETGYANTIIINDTKYGHTGDTPSTSDGEMELSNVKIGNTNVGAAAGYSDVEDAVAHARTVYLSADQLTADLKFTVTSTDGASTAVYGGYKVFATAKDAEAFANTAGDTGSGDTTGDSINISATGVRLGNGNVILIRANDSTGDDTGSGNLTWFAYVITEKA